MLTRLKLDGLVNNSAVNVMGAGNLFTTGKVVYVSSVLGNNNNIGDDPLFPKSTIQGGVAAATGAVGDILAVMPGHAETVTATSHNLSKSGISVVGLGNGLNKPVLTFGAAAATITGSAANVAVKNIDCVANFLNVAAGFTVGAAKDFSVVNSTFRDTSSILNFLSPLVTGATNNDADGLAFIGNNVYSLPTTDGAVVSILANESRVMIADNYADKAATNDAGHFITLSSKIMSGIQVLRNTLSVVGSAGATVGIFLTGSGATSTGVVAFNLASSLDTTTELMFTASTGMKFYENYYTGVADKSGYLVPAADTAA